MPTLLRNFLLFVLGLLVIAGVLSNIQFNPVKVEDADISTLVGYVKDAKVRSIEIHGDSVEAALTDGRKLRVQKENGESFSTLLKNYGIESPVLAGIKTEVTRASGIGYWFSALLPFLIPFILIGAVVFFMMRQVQGVNNRAMSFGQSGARQAEPDAKNKVTFKDVAGLKESKEELQEIVEFLKNPKKFTSVGAKIPKGVLLMGTPGTGKTLLARAVAGEANVPFFHISGSEFVEMFVGVGASRVRDLFRKAKKAAPCILFIDEIDAVGRQRGAGLGGGHDEREQTLNQILVEMDGFDPNVGIIVTAATNRPDILDQALLRPGRFDRRVMLDLPDINDREEILKLHTQGKPIGKDVNLRTIAQRTPGFSGADLANLMNEAAIFAARRNKKEVGASELIESVEKVMLGPERRSHILSEKEKKITAYHEGGHALVGHVLPGADPIRKVSIISRGRAAGYTMKLPSEDRHLKTHAEFLDEIAALLGGHVAEKEIFGDVTTGASNDLKVATQLARKLITEYGMSEKLGLRTFGEHDEPIFLGREISEQRDYSDATALNIDEEINAVLKHAQNVATQIIRDKRETLDRIVEELIKHETLEQEAFEAIVSGEKPPRKEEPPRAPKPRVLKKIAKQTTPRKSIIPRLGPAVV